MMDGWTMGTEAWILMGAWASVMILGIWLLIRSPRHDDREEALRVLRGRLARGEIDAEEFEATRQLLESR